VITADSYPKYQRRDNGRRVKIGLYVYSNQDVVPYNPYLSLRYNAHINVEIAGSISAVKYMCKYVYKGGDRTVAILYNNDRTA